VLLLGLLAKQLNNPPPCLTGSSYSAFFMLALFSFYDYLRVDARLVCFEISFNPPKSLLSLEEFSESFLLTGPRLKVDSG
jgi:hypothetical protein